MTLAGFRNSVVSSTTGLPVSGATVTVTLAGTSTPATIYEDKNAASEITYLATDSDGFFEFYAVAGTYDVMVSLGTSSVVWGDIAIGTMQSTDYNRIWRSGETAEDLDAALDAIIAEQSALQEAIESAVAIPAGANGAGGRDGAGEVVLFTNDDGTITFNADGANRYIRAVTALAAHARTVTTIATDTTSTAAHLVTQVEAGTSNTGTTILKLEHGTPATALTYEFAKSSAVSPAGGSIVLWVSPDQEGTVTLDTEDDAGTINGETSVEVSPGFIYTAVILENPGSAPTIYLSGPVVAQATTLQGGVHERVVTAGVSGAVTIDMSAGSHHVLTMTGNVTGVTLSGRAPDGMSANVRVDWVQDGSGGHTIAHPTGTRWAGGTAPTFVTTAGAVNTVAYSAIGASGAIDGFDGGMGRATP